VNGCAELLEDIAAPHSRVLAYPYGLYDAQTIKHLQSLDCPLQFSTDDIQKSHMGIIGRLVINPFISVQNQIKAINEGKYC